MKYLLDTCVISDFVRGHAHTLDKIKSTEPSNLAISAITHMEIHYGLQRNPKKAKKIAPVLEALFSTMTILPFQENDSEVAGMIRAKLFTQGNPVGPYDILIAATAQTYSLCLVTSNTKEFSRVENLSLEDWRL